jgi:deoxyribodipyrimidine photo-lyase
MSKKINLGIMYFRRDFRLIDNTAFYFCAKENEIILPIFIFNPKQIDEKKNPYYCKKIFSLMCYFLYQLSDEIKENYGSPLHIMHGNPTDELTELYEQLDKHYNVTLYFNMDFTPFSIMRDTEIFNKIKNVKCYCDTLLNPPLDMITEYKPLLNPPEVYKKFTPFYKNANMQVETPRKSNPECKIYATNNQHLIKLLKSQEVSEHLHLFENYDRKHALKSCSANIKYADLHDYPAASGTFRISHYLKFGVISIREAFHNFKQHLAHSPSKSAAIRQLFWREFYTLITWKYPELLGWQRKDSKWIKLDYNYPLNPKYNKIAWGNSTLHHNIFKRWTEGMTGFPIVDAGMRELLATGYMHNRVRLITASFLTKICGIDWREGEKWFARHLIDYDPIINNGNWLWVAGGGADSQPYFRVFNPWLQQKEYDKECVYIRKWIPELESLTNKEIHELYKYDKKIKNYDLPIVTYEDMKEITQDKYKKIYS